MKTQPNELIGEDPHTYEIGKQIEDYADNLMAECVTIKGSEIVNLSNDLYDGDLLPKMMNIIANWTGSTESSVQQIRKLHNLLSDVFIDIARRNVK